MGGGPAAAVCAVVALVLLLTWHFGETPAKQRVYNSSEIARLARRSRSHSHYYVITSPKDHRSFVGGMWSEIGELELAFMRRMGLEQKHTLIDVGCGALRGGVHFVRYLDAEKYYGVDLNPHLLTIGLEKEVAPLGLSSKLPRSHLHATPDFGVDHFGSSSLRHLCVRVTHLPLDEVSKSMHKVAPCSSQRTVGSMQPYDAQGAPLTSPSFSITISSRRLSRMVTRTGSITSGAPRVTGRWPGALYRLGPSTRPADARVPPVVVGASAREEGGGRVNPQDES